MRLRIAGEAAGMRLHRDHLGRLVVAELEIDLAATLGQAYADIVGLFDLPAAEGPVGIFDRVNDLSHPDQVLYLILAQEKRLHGRPRSLAYTAGACDCS